MGVDSVPKLELLCNAVFMPQCSVTVKLWCWKPGCGAWGSDLPGYLFPRFQMPRLWLDYCQFLMDQGRVTHTRRTFDRALRALPITQHSRIWPLYLRFLRSHPLPETAVRGYRRFLKVSHVQLLCQVPGLEPSEPGTLGQ